MRATQVSYDVHKRVVRVTLNGAAITLRFRVVDNNWLRVF